MNKLTLKPINFGFPNQTTMEMDIWELTPPHLPSLLRREYRFLREEGASRRAARWHVHRMVAMISNPLYWRASLLGEPLEEGEYAMSDAAFEAYDDE